MIYIYLMSYVNHQDYGEDPEGCHGEDFFHYDFKGEGTCFKDKGIGSQLLIIFYFISTTLSTVGLGDFRPISDLERLEIIPYLLFGYLIFSYLISEIVD